MFEERLIPLGILVILIGVVLIAIGIISLAFRSKEVKSEGGFVFFLGPIPIVGATSKTMFYLMIALSFSLLILFLILNRVIG